jgi:hypothetical protein
MLQRPNQPGVGRMGYFIEIYSELINTMGISTNARARKMGCFGNLETKIPTWGSISARKGLFDEACRSEGRLIAAKPPDHLHAKRKS